MSDKNMSNAKMFLKTLSQQVMILQEFNADGIDYVTVKLDNGAVIVAQKSEITDIGDNTIQAPIQSSTKSITISLENGEIVDREVQGNFLLGDMITDEKTGKQAKILRIND